jgi:hypothetical protein
MWDECEELNSFATVYHMYGIANVSIPIVPFPKTKETSF